MKIKTSSLLAGVGLFALGLALGVVGSHRYWFDWAVDRLEMEVVGRANDDIITLSRWRTGDEEGARSNLEAAVDRAVASVYDASQSDLRPPPVWTVQLFQLAKVYRTLFPPPAGADPLLIAAIDSVSLPKVKYCDPAVQKLMARLPADAPPAGE